MGHQASFNSFRVELRLASPEKGKARRSQTRKQFGEDGRVAELADATALGAVGETLGGSTPLPPTKNCLAIFGEARQSALADWRPTTPTTMETFKKSRSVVPSDYR